MCVLYLITIESTNPPRENAAPPPRAALTNPRHHGYSASAGRLPAKGNPVTLVHAGGHTLPLREVSAMSHSTAHATQLLEYAVITKRHVYERPAQYYGKQQTRIKTK